MKRFLSEEKYLVNAFLRACDQLGVDYKQAFKTLGLSRVLLSSPETFVPSHLFNAVLEAIARDYHCRDLALHIARNLTTPQLGLAARIAAFSLDLRSGLAHASRYALYYHDTGCWQYRIEDQQVCLYKQATPFTSQHIPQRNLLGTAQMFQLLGLLTDKLWQPSSVSLSFSDPGYRFTETFEAFFQCHLVFDQDKDAIHFAEEYLDYSLGTADPTMLHNLETQVDGLQRALFEDRPPVEQARLIIDQRLRFSSCTAEELATCMGMPLDQMTAIFDGVDTSFEEILEQQTVERARYCLNRFSPPLTLVTGALMPDDPARLAALLTTS